MKLTVGNKEYGTNIVALCIALVVLIPCIIVGVIAYNGGRSGGYDDGVGSEAARIASENLTKEQNEKDKTLKGLKAQIEENQALIEEMNNYKENKETYDAEISEKTSKNEQLDKDISSKQAELDKLTGNVTAAKGAPKTLPAGQYTGGTDIPVGRYSVSGSSNFFVHSAGGSLKVNTILGDSSIGVGTYTCNIAQGDIIEASSSVTFTPIQ